MVVGGKIAGGRFQRDCIICLTVNRISRFTLHCKATSPVDELNKALGDISSIRRQMARSTQFRGYGPVTLAATGLFAFTAAAAQALWLPHTADHIPAYLATWISTAIVSAAFIGSRMRARTQLIHSGMADEMIRMAVEQFLPSAAAGALVTLVLLWSAPAQLWLLPALWQVTFSLGVFASCRFLPRPMLIAGAWYLVTGLCCIAIGDARAFSPWAMGIPYGCGQMLVAAILYFSAEDGDES